jgi:hypothetical protein
LCCSRAGRKELIVLLILLRAHGSSLRAHGSSLRATWV